MITLDELRLIHAAFPWFFPAAAFGFGACIGSFLNVCIYRIPAGQSVVRPGSHCACGQPIRWHDNIPILSWLFLRGRARCCGRRFSVRYPAIELLTALVFLFCALLFPPGKAVCAMLFSSLLITGTFTDIDHMIIPDRCTIGGAVLGVLASLAVPSLHGHTDEIFMVASLKAGIDSLLGLLVGSGIVLWILILAEKILGKEAMGFGDVKLLGCIGAFVGWQGAVVAVFGGSVLGVLATLAWMPFCRQESGAEGASPAPATPPADAPTAAAGTPAGEADGPVGETSPGLMGMPIPFGPMLSAAALLYLLWLHPWVDGYFAEIAQGLQELGGSLR